MVCLLGGSFVMLPYHFPILVVVVVVVAPSIMILSVATSSFNAL